MKKLFITLTLLGLSHSSFAADKQPSSVLDNGVETFAIDCAGNPQQTTLDINACYAEKIDKLNWVKQTYLDTARKSIEPTAKDPDPDPDAAEMLKVFEEETQAWDAFEDKASTATYTAYQGGTIRGAMSMSRRMELIELRIKDIWSNWLQYQDSTPAVLPEPKFKEGD
ncbi:lysozyme inhibitor LprI family protein [Rahnella woolbedingensis]|uniref:Lysozyme inhibitor LprI-like N-terminal domain-containing protein n=1 Tax=Rahnella woolbedingensis TaxID=1510574 RepID=A0A419N7A1_9GAMM|nr:lysozyme inhibitor LprI family protein [Rahnella woolbedingensis]RJT43257.1 hypothetical protein D6C13_14725 [Rahnella woolbedingensis]